MIRNVLKVLFIAMLLSGLSVSALGQGQGAPGPQGQQGPPPDRSDFLKATLGTLVMDGVINKEQAVKTLQYFEKEAATVKEMQENQRREYLKKSRDEHKDALSLLVKDGILTKEQAKAVEKAMLKEMPPGKPGDFSK